MRTPGYTLIEVVITITIMAMISIVIGTNMLGLFTEEEDKSIDSFYQRITNAGCMYVETKFSKEERDNCRRRGCTITVDNLIQSGIIGEDEKDPSTDELIINNKNKYKVNVKWVNNEKTCTLEGE